MAQKQEKPSITSMKSVMEAEPGSHTVPQSPNLILKVKPTGARSWIFRYSAGGKIRDIGLGSAGQHGRSLTDAKDLADKMRVARREGRDPKTVLPGQYDHTGKTFREYAEAFIAQKKREFSNGKHAAQWPSTLEKWVHPIVGDKRPQDISYGDVEEVLTQPALEALRETQSRVRQRMLAVLDYAALREHEPNRFNPVVAYRIRLPRGEREQRKERHFPAAKWQDAPAIVAALHGKDSTSALLLRFQIATAVRPGEARGAMWAETDLEAGEWRLPAAKMKSRKEHIVPLNAEAIAVLRVMAERRAEGQELVFPGPRGGKLSDVAANKALASAAKSVGIQPDVVTAHGFRSTFRDYVAEETDFPGEVAEAALAHTITNKVEAAYRRGKLLDKRRRLMEVWNNYILKEVEPKSNVVDILANKLV